MKFHGQMLLKFEKSTLPGENCNPRDCRDALPPANGPTVTRGETPFTAQNNRSG